MSQIGNSTSYRRENGRTARASDSSKERQDGFSRAADEKNVGEGSRHADAALFSVLLCGQQTINRPALPAGSENIGSLAPQENQPTKPLAIVRQWAEKLWFGQSSNTLHITSRVGDMPLTLTSSQVNGMLSIAVSCANPALLEKMKRSRAELDGKKELARVSVVFSALPATPSNQHFLECNSDDIE